MTAQATARARQTAPRHRPDLEATRRAQIIAATRACIVAKGCEATTIRDVVAASGVSAGTISYYFLSKETLLTATLQYLADEFESRIVQAMADVSSDPLARLTSLIEAGLPEPGDAAGANDSWSLWLEFWGQARRQPALGRVHIDLYVRWRAAIRSMIEEGMATGRFSLVQAGDVARQLAGLIDGLAVQCLMGDPDAGVSEVRRLCLGYVRAVLQPRQP